MSDYSPWGNEHNNQPPNHLRIGLLNIGGFPLTSTDEENDRIRATIKTNNIDIMMITETNKHWKSLPIKDRLPERTKGWFESLHRSTAYYENYPDAFPQQFGGVTLWSMGQAAHRVTTSGRDPSGLGRWTWTRYSGASGFALRVICGYRPVDNKKGPQSVWNQHKQYYDDNDIDNCPRQQFIEDISKQLRDWIDQGDQLVFGLDVNDDVRNGPFTSAMTSAGMTELII